MLNRALSDDSLFKQLSAAMIKAIQIYFTVLLFSTIGFAQNAVIEGNVVLEANQPLEFSTAALYRIHDSTFVSGTASDVNGVFRIPSLKGGNYYLAVKFLGYTTAYIPNIKLEENQTKNVGAITLKPNAALLNEIVVRGEKENAYHHLDKQVFTTAQFQSAQGGTATDILKNLPAVSVNSDGDITLRGSSSFIVLLDGKPIQTDPAVILNQLPANTIENVEIITTPSSKYDPDGKSGIVNIITKKGATNGYYLLLNAQGGLPSIQDYGNENKPVRYAADVTANYKYNSLNASLSGNYKRDDIAGYRDGEAETYLDNIYTTLPSLGERSYRSYSYSIKGNINYQINRTNSIEAGFYGGKRSQFRKANIVYDQHRYDQTTGEEISAFRYFNKNFRERRGDFAVANLDFNHVFENKALVTVSALYEKTILGGPTKNKDVNPDDESVIYNDAVNEESNPLDGIRLKADYTLPVKKSGKLETGYQYRYLLHEGSFTYNQRDIVTNAWFVRSELSNSVTLTRDIHSGYFQYSDQIAKLSYSAGLRGEYVSRRLQDESKQDPYLFERFNFFPSANILYGLNNGYKLKAGYSRRIVHTTSNMMNPFPARRHSEVFETGDPNLLPEYVDVAELGGVKDFHNNSVFANVYYRGTKNVINRVNSIYNDSILVRTFTNAGNASSYGLEVGVDLKPATWWSIFAGGNLYRYVIKGNVFGNDVNTNSFNYLLNANTTFKLIKTVTLQLTLNYTSETATAQGSDSRFVIPSATLRKTFWDGQASLSLQWQNIDIGLFDANQQRLTTRGDGFYTSTNYIQEVDVLRLNFSYQINKLVKKVKFTESEFGEREF